jgi:mxaJ protein
MVLAVAPLGVRADELRVCADPNNLPFSNEQQQGFENRIMSVVADELGDTLSYVWWAQRRGLITNALNEGLCDIIPGIGTVSGVLLTYPPYYRSSYVFVARRDGPHITSFDDPLLRKLKLGVQLVGGDNAASPPALALSRRGIVDNVQGFMIAGDYAKPNPPAREIDAVADGDVDVAVAWGPMAAYFANREPVPLTVTPLERQADTTHLPMAFDISMGLRLDEGALRHRIETALRSRKAEIDAVLAQYDVPRLDRVQP